MAGSEATTAVPAQLETLYANEDLAERYKVPVKTVRTWRYLGTGPRGVRFGRRVLYTESALLEWEAAQRDAQAS